MEAEKYLAEAEALIRSGVPYNVEIINAYNHLQLLHAKYGNYVKAYFYQNKYVLLKDSIYNHQLTTNLMKIEAEHLEKENKAKIQTQSQILSLNQEVIVRQKSINLFVGLVALLLVTVTALLVKSNRQKQRINSLLDTKVRERTIALALNQDVLERACYERDALLEKMSKETKAFLLTMKGLCGLGLKDVRDPLALEYFVKMNSTSEKCFEILDRLKTTNGGK